MGHQWENQAVCTRARQRRRTKLAWGDDTTAARPLHTGGTQGRRSLGQTADLWRDVQPTLLSAQIREISGKNQFDRQTVRLWRLRRLLSHSLNAAIATAKPA